MRRVRKLCVLLFALDVFFFAIAAVMTYLALTKVPGAVEVGTARVLMDAYGIELGTLAGFGVSLVISALPLAGALFCTLPERLHKQVIFYISAGFLAFLTPWTFLSALNDTVVFFFRINLLGTLDLVARSLVVVIPGWANILVSFLYIDHILKTATNRGANATGY